jgi:hypothetical protein
MITPFAGAISCSRAARFGVSPTNSAPCVAGTDQIADHNSARWRCRWARQGRNRSQLCDALGKPDPPARPVSVSRELADSRNKSRHRRPYIGDIAVELGDLLSNGGVIGAEHLAQILRIETGGKRGRAGQIANITVSWRRSAPVSILGAADIGAPSAGSALMASSRRRRWPMEAMPSSLRSSAVRLRSTSQSMSFSRNAGPYCSRPSSRNQPAMSTRASTRPGRRSPVQRGSILSTPSQTTAANVMLVPGRPQAAIAARCPRAA